MSKQPTHYELLQIAAGADPAAIAAAYERLRAQYDAAHLADAAPELRELAAARSAELARAHAILSDPASRASYDQELAGAAEPAEELDYRPLPARRSETVIRPISSAAPARRHPHGGSRRRELALLAMIALLSLGVTAGLVWVGSRPAAPAAQPAMPLSASAILVEIPDPAIRDQILSLDAMAAQGLAAVQQDPRNPNAWIFLGNAHYDFIQTIYENAPRGEAYAQNLGRWLDASEAYTRALALEPLQTTVRADYGLALVRYGNGFGNMAYVEQGLAEAERALREDNQTPHVLLTVGRALAAAQPPRAAEARQLWERVIALAPDSPQAAQAQKLLEGGQP